MEFILGHEQLFPSWPNSFEPVVNKPSYTHDTPTKKILFYEYLLYVVKNGWLCKLFFKSIDENIIK